MNNSLRHRGPDAGAVTASSTVVFGHRRLAVIDLSPEANQPMADAAGRFLIVYNGELYNFRELRANLERDGTRFRTQSDTEVILEAYGRWGLEAFARFNGMFALALWDEPHQRLVLVRDRAGEKPLFYCQLPDGMAFASELGALRQHPQVSSRLNPAALGQFLALNYVMAPDSLVDGVRKLEPGHLLVVNRGGAGPALPYWDLATAFHVKQRFADTDEAAEALRAQLDEAVRLRLVSDVPLGAFLSGGLDSSSIVAAMCRLRDPQSNVTFSFGFEEATFNELPWARRAADALGVGHHHEGVAGSDIVDTLPAILAAADEPMADTSVIPMYYLARLARQHVTVCLSGDGGDEALGGYQTYVADGLLRYAHRVPGPLTRFATWAMDHLLPVTFNKVSYDYKVRQFLRGMALPFPRAHYSWRTIFGDDERRSLLRPEHHEAVLGPDPFEAYGRHFEAVRDCHFLDQALYVDTKTWLPNDILTKVDRMTMAHSLEARAPFLDHTLLEFAASLPPDLKVRGRTTKVLLKQSQAGRVPADIRHRGKQGFNAPVSHWLAGPIVELGRDATSSARLGQWFRPEAVARLWDEHVAKTRDHGFKLFGLMCLGLWMEAPS